MPTQKNRAQLRNLFQSGAKPTSGDFADFIQSSLNALEDGIFTQPGDDDPLKIAAKGERANLLDLYVDDAHFWRFNARPGANNTGFNLSYGGVSKLFVETATGNIGLGTIAPEKKIDAAGDIRAFGGKLIAGDDKTDTVEIGHEAGGDAYLDITGSGSLDFRVNGDTRLTLDSDGNALFGSSTRQMLNLYDTSFGVGVQGSTLYFRASNQFAWYAGGSHNDGSFNGGGGSARMVINSQGNVGINTTAPAAKLVVNGGVHIGGTSNPGDNNLQVDGSVLFGSSTRQMLNLYGTRFGIGVQSGTLYFRSDSYFCWFKGGSHHDATLASNGGGIALMALDPAGTLGLLGRLNQGSDISLKEDINPIQDSLVKIMALKPYSFHMKDSEDPRKSLGFVAQEVEPIMPDTVGTMGPFKSLVYNDFTVLAIAGIQEQQTQIDALRREVDALKAAS